MGAIELFIRNKKITIERFYKSSLRYVLQAFAGESVLITLNASLL